MEIIIVYMLLFCIGTVFGSFFTLAVYRLPLKKDITHERSFCPKCEHKLSFWDMIPIVSYIGLGGKCRYCKEKIRPRYCILEIISGFLFVLYAMSIPITQSNILSVDTLIALVTGLLYIAGLVVLAGIDIEKKQIHTGILVYEALISAGYTGYLLLCHPEMAIRFIAYFAIILITFLLLAIDKKQKQKDNYSLKILILAMIMGFFANSSILYITIIVTLITIGIYAILQQLMKKEVNKAKLIPIGYYLCICNIVTMLLIHYFNF